MKRLETWLAEYGESHRHPLNKRLHWVCVPLIVFSLLGLLRSVPFPGDWPVWVNWAALLVTLALFYYAALAPRLVPAMLVVLLGTLWLVEWLAGQALPLWQGCLAIFVLAWIGQFIGHEIEGKRPSFFQDLQFLLIGPLWLLAFVYRRLDWRV